jgi:ubiquinone/menaquinone biosynthesis C-methylase UbiE
MSQKAKFLQSEGDAYFSRNAGHASAAPYPVTPALQALNLHPRAILEIGCSDGFRLDGMRKTFGAKCSGIDPSSEAVEGGMKVYPGLDLRVGTADKLPFADASFDVVIFGFCLYLCDPTDHFQITAEATRVLSDPGVLVIYDFNSPAAYRRKYAHKSGVFSHKMDFASLFTAHPGYRLLSRTYNGDAALSVDECVTVDVLRKDMAGAFPNRDHATPTAVI